MLLCVGSGSGLHDLRSITGTEAVASIPSKVGTAQIRDRDGSMEPSELPGPAREVALSDTRREAECAMPKRGVVARARRVQAHVGVQRCTNGIAGIDHR